MRFTRYTMAEFQSLQHITGYNAANLSKTNLFWKRYFFEL